MYIADLHIHSRYSRATSRDCTPEYLDLWARRKGIRVIGTGDFTHPAWRQELWEKLKPAEQGYYVLKEEYRIQDSISSSLEKPRFVVTGEISTIYKKYDRTRKVHSLILLPGLQEAEEVSNKLEAIGNIYSDGRPILGLDCRDLLEIILDICPEAIYVPAHIWTPHFSLFGAFSGFDSVEECFGDLASHIHAMETGLSSDPPMNWRLSALDSYQLISNSDAHSPGKLGREANLLDAPLNYHGLYEAIQEGKGLLGTIEFFPEEGKYHMDGHRKCSLCLKPAETIKYGGKCPVCGRKLTIGVSHRVERLADREEGFLRKQALPFESLVPLPEVIQACTGLSASGKKAQAQYEDMLKNLGAEFAILREASLEDIRYYAGERLSEGIRRLRAGLVKRIPGYDGEYGIIDLFEPWEIKEIEGQMDLFSAIGLDLPGTEEQTGIKELHPALAFREPSPADRESAAAGAAGKAKATELLNREQETAVMFKSPEVAVIAGPGTGKTKTLVSRILYFIEERRIKPSEITAVTFTNQAAGELYERLKEKLGSRKAGQLTIGTFHSICYKLLKKYGSPFYLADEMDMEEFAEETVKEFSLKYKAAGFLRKVSRRKAGLSEDISGENTEDIPLEAFAWYQNKLKEAKALDYDDLILEALKLIRECDIPDKNFTCLFVDEFQDINPVQFDLIRAFHKLGRELFVIGDPNQAVYGFRGSDARCFDKLKEEYPGLEIIELKTNYRSTPQILTGAQAVMEKGNGRKCTLEPVLEDGHPIRLVKAKSKMEEGIFTAKEINRLLGGMDMLEAQKAQHLGRESGWKPSGFSDFAVLYRTHRQAEILEKCLRQEGIPYVVAGRDDYLLERRVRGSISFFKYMLDETDAMSLGLARKLLWEREEKEMLPDFLELEQKYRTKVKRIKPQKLWAEWSADMGFEGQDAVKRTESAAGFSKTMAEFLEKLSFGREGDIKRCSGKEYSAEAVTLMTLHGSKGLEFPAVFICGVSEGLIPYQQADGTGQEEEERRLFYVGMTRAMQELILVTSDKPSVYLEDIPRNAVTNEECAKRRDNSVKQMELWDFM